MHVIYHSLGNRDVSNFSVSFDGEVIFPSESVKGAPYPKPRRLSSTSSQCLTCPNSRDVVIGALDGTRSRIIFGSTAVGLRCFLVLSPPTNRSQALGSSSAARCITGAYRTASLAALEKEAAMLPAGLRLELSLLNRLARYLTLPGSHGLTPLLKNAISSSPRNPKLASPLHFVKRLPCVTWPEDVPARGQRLKDRKPPKVAAAPRADQSGSGARRKRGGTVTELNTRGLSPPHGDTQVQLVSVPSVTFAVPTSQARTASVDFTLGMESILPVYTPPWAEPLPVTTIISSKDKAVAVLQAMLADEGLRQSTWFTDGCPSPTFLAFQLHISRHLPFSIAPPNLKAKVLTYLPIPSARKSNLTNYSLLSRLKRSTEWNSQSIDPWLYYPVADLPSTLAITTPFIFKKTKLPFSQKNRDSFTDKERVKVSKAPVAQSVQVLVSKLNALHAGGKRKPLFIRDKEGKLLSLSLTVPPHIKKALEDAILLIQVAMPGEFQDEDSKRSMFQYLSCHYTWYARFAENGSGAPKDVHPDNLRKDHEKKVNWHLARYIQDAPYLTLFYLPHLFYNLDNSALVKSLSRT
ncbi:hypothetical protein B0H13DRAFT_2522226 [Mycena leptocephala]|nr:hypothetical protein B0H13DRAFT_2522226 [Mycena leptocephala]